MLADWLDALRRHDFATVERRMDPEVFWQGIRENFIWAKRLAYGRDPRAVCLGAMLTADAGAREEMHMANGR